jgi:hypothetical protein
MPPSARSNRNRRSSGTVEMKGSPERPRQENHRRSRQGRHRRRALRSAPRPTLAAMTAAAAPVVPAPRMRCARAEPAAAGPSVTARPAALTGAGGAAAPAVHRRSVTVGPVCARPNVEPRSVVAMGVAAAAAVAPIRARLPAERPGRAAAVAASATRAGRNARRQPAPANQHYARPVPVTGRDAAIARPSSPARATSFAAMGPA